MTAPDLIDHLLNFVAPAFGVAVLLAVMARLLIKKRPVTPSLWVQAAINFFAGVLVLAAGLGYYGHDGMMMTYAALVVVCGTAQWWLSGAWRP